MSADKPFGMPDLPDCWHWDYFENLCSKVSVGHVGETSSFFTRKEEGIPFIRSQNVKPGKLMFNDIKFVTYGFHNKSKKSQLLAGDILIVRVGQNRGDCCVLPENTGEINCANIVFGRLSNLKYSNYIGCFFNSELGRAGLLAVSSGSAQGVLNTKAIAKVVVPVPPEDLAEDIGDKLSSFDKKIELNRQTNQTLEQIAQALFKSWFVDFAPVKAKIIAQQKGGDDKAQTLAAQAIICGALTLEQLQALAADKIALETQLQTTLTNHLSTDSGLASLTPETLQKTAELFPNALVESELGEVPEGWGVQSLSAVINVTGGGTPKRSEKLYWNGDIPWFSVKDTPASSDTFVVDTIEKITELGLKKSSTRLLPAGTTIITARGTVGKLALVGTPMCMNQSCYGVLGVRGIGPYFNYLNLCEAVDTLKRNTHGAVFDTITTQTFESYSLAICSEGLTDIFEKAVTPVFKKIELSCRESIALSECRDTLLPKLLSGELSVPRSHAPAW